MILDAKNEFFSQQVLTANKTSKVIDLCVRGTGATHIPVLLQVTDDAVGGGTAKVTFEGSETEDFAVKVELESTAAIPAVTLKAGYKLPIRVLPRSKMRYIRAQLIVAGLTAGKIEVAVTTGISDNKE